MKKLLILPLFVLLTGCVTYYYPETALEDGVYYAENDPSYVVYSDDYTATAYYPWSSLDYFYLGYNPYPRYGFGYGYGGHGSGFSFGISYGYSPWYYPYSYYGYYSPWYASYSHYPYYPAWRSYNGYCSRHNGCYHRGQNNHRNGHDRYARNGHDDPRNRASEDARDNEYRADRRSAGSRVGYDGASPVSRYVSTAPAGHSGNRGLVIRSREDKKVGKSRLHPDKSVPVQAINVTSSNSGTAQPDYRTRRAGGEIQYRSQAKQTRSRTGPVESSPSSKGIAITAPPSRTVVASGNDGSNRQSVRTKTAPQASGRPPSGPAPQPPATSKPRESAGKNNRSPSRSSSSGRRDSKKSNSSERENRK